MSEEHEEPTAEQTESTPPSASDLLHLPHYVIRYGLGARPVVEEFKGGEEAHLAATSALKGPIHRVVVVAEIRELTRLIAKPVYTCQHCSCRVVMPEGYHGSPPVHNCSGTHTNSAMERTGIATTKEGEDG